jgi:hypothetical protein
VGTQFFALLFSPCFIWISLPRFERCLHRSHVNRRAAWPSHDSDDGTVMPVFQRSSHSSSLKRNSRGRWEGELTHGSSSSIKKEDQHSYRLLLFCFLSYTRTVNQRPPPLSLPGMCTKSNPRIHYLSNDVPQKLPLRELSVRF